MSMSRIRWYRHHRVAEARQSESDHQGHGDAELNGTDDRQGHDAPRGAPVTGFLALDPALGESRDVRVRDQIPVGSPQLLANPIDAPHVISRLQPFHLL